MARFIAMSARNDPSEYLEFLEGKHASCCTLDLDLAEHGYVLLQEDFQNGFYERQTPTLN